MKIVHKLEGFLREIFPGIDIDNPQSVIAQLEKYYTYGPYKPKVTIKDGWVIINIDTPTIMSQDADYRKTVSLCEKGKFSEAKPILANLIKNNPTNSEYHRIMGQILSDEGDQEEAINSLIDALRWDAKNGYALVMMGNIFAKHRDDIQTAMKYYDQAIKVNPKDNIAINNIGANLLNQGKVEEAEKYFHEALKINSEYPNTHLALAMIAQMSNDLHSAFYSTIEAIKLNKHRDPLYINSLRQAFEIAGKIVEMNQGMQFVNEYQHKLEFADDKKIEVIKDPDIPTAAKIEFAENYQRDHHLVRYKPAYPAVEHLIMHELVHLDFVQQARKEDQNMIFITNQEHKSGFIRRLEPFIKKLNKAGMEDSAIADYCSHLFSGMNTQLYNTPIDLFIEDYLYKNYAELRPYQFISLFNMIQEGLKAVTDKKAVELSPRDILSKSKILNMVNAMQFKDLYGIDLIPDFKALPAELSQARSFYDEFLQYRDDREPAEEYELVMNWSEDLKLDKNFELVNETEYRSKRTDLDQLLESIEKDPFDTETHDPQRERDMEKFQKAQKEMGVNMAVVMFMVDALQFFKGMETEEIRKIAFEIAMQGTQGYNPEKKDYRISAIPGKKFSGYHILAYYYVSWAMAIPDMLSQLQLPYDKEYELALTMHKH